MRSIVPIFTARRIVVTVEHPSRVVDVSFAFSSRLEKHDEVAGTQMQLCGAVIYRAVLYPRCIRDSTAQRSATIPSVCSFALRRDKIDFTKINTRFPEAWRNIANNGDRFIAVVIARRRAVPEQKQSARSIFRRGGKVRRDLFVRATDFSNPQLGRSHYTVHSAPV